MLYVDKKKVAVSATPGKTKHFQTIELTNTNLTLCDCPGLVFPSFMTTKSEMVCNGLIRIDEIRDVLGPASIVCRRIPRIVLETMYGVIFPKPQPPDDPNRPPYPDELLSAYAFVRGFMASHGMPDKHRAARVILKDFVNGILLYCHPPNGVNPEEFNPQPKLKKQVKEHHNRNQDEEDKKDPLEIKEFDINGKDNPNNRLKKARGRKYQKRMKQQLKLQGNVYNTGRNPLIHKGKHTAVPGKSLPTSVILKNKNDIQVYKKKRWGIRK